MSQELICSNCGKRTGYSNNLYTESLDALKKDGWIVGVHIDFADRDFCCQECYDEYTKDEIIL